MELYEMADQLAPSYPSPLYFNGNDAITLPKNGTIIDIIGKIGENPGDAWTDDASAGFTETNGGACGQNHTMKENLILLKELHQTLFYLILQLNGIHYQ